jgi:prepilin-type N-terminal cleavage/methylation domain-containing protein
MRMTNSNKRLNNERGVSLTEMMLTLAVAAIVTGMAAALMADSRRASQGDGAMRLVMAELNAARETAMTQRRSVEVQFLGGMWIKSIRHEVNNSTTVIHTVALEGNMQFSLVPNIPDTPDGFGNASPVAFGAALSIQFNGDGALVDSGGTPVNGTVFLSFQQKALTYRAVTVLGSTGRVRGYKWISNQNGHGWSRV